MEVSSQLHHRGKNPQYTLAGRLGGLQSESGCCGIEKNLLPLPGIEPQPSSPESIIIPTELNQLLNFMKTSNKMYKLI
jgi:hypothetical protein